jgi:hypothetical protein
MRSEAGIVLSAVPITRAADGAVANALFSASACPARLPMVAVSVDELTKAAWHIASRSTLRWAVFKASPLTFAYGVFAGEAV